MQDRRQMRRQRVCLEGAVSNDLRRAAKPARVRDLSEHGAQVVLNDILPVAGGVAFSISRRTSDIRQAEIVWQRGNQVGLRFSATRPAPADPLSRLLDQRRD